MHSGVVERIDDGIPANTEGNNGAFGNRVRVRCNWNDYGGQQGDPDIYISYTHLNAIENINLGDSVIQGALLGQSGRTGNAINIATWRYHTHILICSGGPGGSNAIDPRPFFFTQFDLYGNPTN